MNPTPSTTAPDAPAASPASRGRSRALQAVLPAALLALAGLAFWNVAVKPNLWPQRFGVVVPEKIFRCARITPAALERVHRKHGIKTIIDLGAYEPGSTQDARAQRAADSLGITRRVFRLEGDASGDPNRYVDALRVMADADAHPILVHCAAGTQRTGCAVALYRHIFEGREIIETYREAMRYDHDAGDNPWLLSMIGEYADDIRHALLTGEPIAYPRVAVTMHPASISGGSPGKLAAQPMTSAPGDAPAPGSPPARQ